MSQLLNQTKNLMVTPRLQVAKSLWSRAKGLLGTQNLAADAGLWIHETNNIHTFFMNYAIDCIFVDQDLKVKAVYQNVKPFRVVWPFWISAKSVFELPANASSGKIQVGDQLHVVH